MINFLNIYKQDQKIQKKITKRILNIIKSNDFISGNDVYIFENKFAKFCSAKNCISVGNGTDALFVALKSLN